MLKLMGTELLNLNKLMDLLLEKWTKKTCNQKMIKKMISVKEWANRRECTISDLKPHLSVMTTFSVIHS